MTLAEKILWLFLRDAHFAGLRFRRQHPLGLYIVDFYCSQKKLIIELDGEYHYMTTQEDRGRDTFLKRHGYHVLHFTNEYIFDHLEQTFRDIADELAIDWQPKDFDDIRSVKFTRKLNTLLSEVRKYKAQDKYNKPAG
jgi:very-short-patch-repair endonuclease